MKRLNRILDNMLAIFFGMIVGVIMTFIIFKGVLQDLNTASEEGYKRGQQECRDFIKNTK